MTPQESSKLTTAPAARAAQHAPARTVLAVQGLGKAYKRYPSKWARLREWLTGHVQHEQTWVLRHVGFTLQAGEAVGIIGANGAGKSTLLKIITGTTQASTGQVQRKGRIAALLELGMGFHPDFSGRQNAFMAGQLLGLSTAEITAHMPAIEAFAEIGEYIDRPVRTYSSGMQVRLAFSVATAVRPDVLIVDEALSVGDAYFQHKCFARIKSFREQGSSLLIVSHDRSAIQLLCDRAILLEKGQIVRDGAPEEILDYYNALIAERKNSTVTVSRQADGRAQTQSGSGEARVQAITLLNSKGEPAEYIGVGEPVRLRVEISVHAALQDLVFGYMIKDRLGQSIFGTNTHHMQFAIPPQQPGDHFTLELAFTANLGVGSYSITTALHVSDTHLAANFEWKDLAHVFQVVNIDRALFTGVNWMPPSITYQEGP